MNLRDLRVIIGACLLAGAMPAAAQSVIATDAPASLTPSGLRASDAAQQPAPNARPPAEPAASPFKWGSIIFRPHIADRFLYSDGLLASPGGRKLNSYVNTLSPGFLLEIGSHWLVDYTPTWTVYTSRDFRNSVDQMVNLTGGIAEGNWVLGFTQNYTRVSSLQIETARQTDQEIVVTGVSAVHRFDSNLSLEITAAQNLRFIKAFPDSYDWSTTDWLHYRISPGLDVAAGYSLGYTDIDPGSHMIYSRPQARFTWQLTDKLTLSANAGRETRRVYTGGAPAVNNPLFGASLQFKPFEHTRFTFDTNRTVAASYFTNDVTVSTGWNATLEQRLFGHFTLSAGISGQKTHYIVTRLEIIRSASDQDILDDDGNVIGVLTTTDLTPNIIFSRRDDAQHSFNVKLSTILVSRASIAILYQERHNSSNVPGYGFTSHQVGCEIGYKY